MEYQHVSFSSSSRVFIFGAIQCSAFIILFLLNKKPVVDLPPPFLKQIIRVGMAPIWLVVYPDCVMLLLNWQSVIRTHVGGDWTGWWRLSSTEWTVHHLHLFYSSVFQLCCNFQICALDFRLPLGNSLLLTITEVQRLCSFISTR